MESAVERFQQFINVFLGALHCARRLAFSLARDSALARKSDIKRYSRMSARGVAVPLPMTSGIRFAAGVAAGPMPDADALGAVGHGGVHRQPLRRLIFAGDDDVDVVAAAQTRSEEHTAEIQSPCNLVCR